MENLTAQKFSQYSQKYANSAKLDNKGEMQIINTQQAQEIRLFKTLRTRSFFGLVNVVKTTQAQGQAIGLDLPMPSITDTDTKGREPVAGFIKPPHVFQCQQVNFDSFVSYGKLDALQNYLDVDFDEELNFYLDKNLISGLLMLAFNGKNRNQTGNSAPELNSLAEDVKKGWLQLIRENAANNVINGAEIGEGKAYKNLNALIKAALDKIPQPHRAHSDLIAICGRNVLADYPVSLGYMDLGTRRVEEVIVADKLIGGVRAIIAPYFPENSILITRLDNLSLFIQSGTIRHFLENTPAFDRFEHYQSLALDFVVEDYQACALIDNINAEG